jgi:hypothetical protein
MNYAARIIAFCGLLTLVLSFYFELWGWSVVKHPFSFEIIKTGALLTIVGIVLEKVSGWLPRKG